ncbi:MAG: tetratricopeptide repeat protein [Candidatus Omnitrophica bacterium]|jgi:tetratricopeptide (TPR) repeat protein|nr:tetratricopeptide repeat protein [Candidatus Omnitrophota bacterium]MDD3274626.1 tetratricopeptide repeat protein [Candidatus Omnitrophota bacterium]MDD5078410.1 tetratricopeptide repeat protein [Candidatus Omnitrophota bacterium]
MGRTGSAIKIIAGFALAVPVICILLGAGLKDTSVEPEDPDSVYRDAMMLKLEAEKDVASGKWGDAAEKYRSVLLKLEASKKGLSEDEKPKIDQVDEEYSVGLKRLDKLDATVLSREALGYYEERNYDEAFLTYNKILEKYGQKYKQYPIIPAAWSHLGHINRIRGRYEEALKDYSVVLSQYAGAQFQYFITNSQVGMAVVYHMMGKDAEAERILQDALTGNPSFAEHFGFIFDILPVKSWGRLGDSFPLIYEFLSTSMPEGEFRLSIAQQNPNLAGDVDAFVGLRFHLKGDTEKAEDYYRKCIKYAPDKESVGYHLALDGLRKLESQVPGAPG